MTWDGEPTIQYTVGDDGYVHSLDCGDHFMSAYVQSQLNTFIYIYIHIYIYILMPNSMPEVSREAHAELEPPHRLCSVGHNLLAGAVCVKTPAGIVGILHLNSRKSKDFWAPYENIKWFIF